MDINLIPESFQSKIRLAIVSALITGDKTFTEIKEITQATDGNLSIHLSKLEESEYLKVTKEFVSKKPRTTYSLTTKGKKEFKEYVELLEQLLKQVKP
jgi:DNA-binding HxlR family transcriptional regulator